MSLKILLSYNSFISLSFSLLFSSFLTLAFHGLTFQEIWSVVCRMFYFSIFVLFPCSEIATHSSTLAWKIPWTEEPGKLQSMGSLRVGHDWATSLSLFTFMLHFHALEKEMATHSSVLAWRIPGTGEPGGLPSLGWHRVGHDWSDLAAAAIINIILSYFLKSNHFIVILQNFSYLKNCWMLK